MPDHYLYRVRSRIAVDIGYLYRFLILQPRIGLFCGCEGGIVNGRNVVLAGAPATYLPIGDITKPEVGLPASGGKPGLLQFFFQLLLADGTYFAIASFFG